MFRCALINNLLLTIIKLDHTATQRQRYFAMHLHLHIIINTHMLRFALPISLANFGKDMNPEPSATSTAMYSTDTIENPNFVYEGHDAVIFPTLT